MMEGTTYPLEPVHLTLNDLFLPWKDEETMKRKALCRKALHSFFIIRWYIVSYWRNQQVKYLQAQMGEN